MKKGVVLMNHRRKSFYLIVLTVFAVLMLSATSAFAAVRSLNFSGNIASDPQYDLYSVDLAQGNIVTATTFCADPPNNTLDSILTVFFPGSDSSDTDNANVYDDDGGSQACGGFRNSTLRFVAPENGTFTFRVDGFGSATGEYTLFIQIDPGSNPMLSDGRINGQQAAPVILYCADATTIVGLSTDGQVLFRLANGETGSGANWSMGTAPDGRMLLTSTTPDGKAYYFAFPGCPHGHYDAFAGDPPTAFDSGDY
jgi:hypothetical protein